MLRLSATINYLHDLIKFLFVYMPTKPKNKIEKIRKNKTFESIKK